MRRTVLSAALLASSVVILGSAQPSFSEEYKLREAAEYVQARGGEPIPNVRTSEHFALKWGNENNKNYKMDEEYIQGALKWFEHVRSVYKDQVGWPFVKSEKDKYKINIYISETGLKPFLTGYAFGFPDPDGYGVFDAEPSCMVWGHGASAHELGHSAEGETGNFRDSDYVGYFWECCAQFMSVQAIPGDAPSLALFCDMSQFDFATAVNWHQYANWPFMQYFKEQPQYGYKFVVDLWMNKGAYQDEDPISKMKRLNKFSAEQWTDIVGDYAKRNATFNSYEYGKKYREALSKANEKNLSRWKINLEPIKGQQDWFRIPYAAAPHQTAFNVIPLTPTSNTISIELKGLVDEVRKSDWRATIVAANDKNQDRYSTTIKPGGATSIKLQPNEKEVYLVVAAEPGVYDAIGFLRDYRTQERFPYEVKIVGADPKGKDPVKLAAPEGVAGSAHPNGGGFVAATAKVDPSAFVGPNARVLDTAQVKDNARIEDYAVVSKEAVVSGSAIVSGHALVTDKATVSGNARIRDYARIYDTSNIEGNARFFDYAEAQGKPHVYENVVARHHSNINGGNLHGTAVFIGATNPGADITDCSKGVYWKYLGQEDCNKAFDLGGLYVDYDCNRINNLLLRDGVARVDGFLKGGPQYVKAPGAGYALAFDGKSQYVEMPKCISDLRDMNLTIMVKWAGGAAGQKVFDFGCDTANSMYFTPKSDSGKAAFVIVKDGRPESIEADALPEGKWCQVTINLKGDHAVMAIDGKVAASGTITANPEDLRADSNYLARGQQDGFFAGELDDFRIQIAD